MNGDTPGRGSYPVGDELNWHGGLHLTAPPVSAGQVESVRAIADGKVVYLRKRTEVSDINDPLNYGDGYTSDACVVIEHQTDIGDGANASSITYYSLYHHLYAIGASVKLNQPIYRKDIIGQAGHIYGSPNYIHFEICCDDDNLKKLVGRKTGLLLETTHGRSDVIFGEIYFKLPLNTPVFAEKPLPHLTQAMGLPPGSTVAHPLPPQALQPVHTLQEQVYIGLRYAGGEGAEGHRGSAYLTTYAPKHDDKNQPVLNEYMVLTANDGVTALEDAGAEYKLYERATSISMAYQTAGSPAVPAASAVYELLRFGRIINTAHETLNPTDIPNWQQVRFRGGVGWVNVNVDGVKVFSDADFPHWKGWRLIDDDVDEGTDSACDSPTIKRWLDADGDSIVELAERHTQLGEAEVQTKLERTICKFPSEWDEGTIDQRWAWRKSRTDENPQPLSDEDFTAMKAHVKALCIPCDSLIKARWRFNPRRFIEVFRACGWLSGDDLARIYTPTPKAVREKYTSALNIMMRRYMVTSGVRKSHFLGQGAVESDFLRSMQEKSMSGTAEGQRLLGSSINQASTSAEVDLGHWYGSVDTENDPWFRLEKYNSHGARITGSYSWLNGNVGDVDAQKFRGRGFKQLTGLDNYAEYWVYRGWLTRDSFDANWWDDREYIARRPTRMRRRPAQVPDPQRITTAPENCMDSGGWYMIFRRPKVMSVIDADFNNQAKSVSELASERNTSRSVTSAINGGYIDADRRLKYTRQAKEVLL